MLLPDMINVFNVMISFAHILTAQTSGEHYQMCTRWKNHVQTETIIKVTTFDL